MRGRLSDYSVFGRVPVLVTIRVHERLHCFARASTSLWTQDATAMGTDPFVGHFAAGAKEGESPLFKNRGGTLVQHPVDDLGISYSPPMLGRLLMHIPALKSVFAYGCTRGEKSGRFKTWISGI